MNREDCVLVSVENYPLFSIEIQNRKQVTEDFLVSRIKYHYDRLYGTDANVSVGVVDIGYGHTGIQMNADTEDSKLLTWTFFPVIR